MSTTDAIICRESKKNLGNHTVIFLCITGTYKECKWMFDKWKNKFFMCLNLSASHLVEGLDRKAWKAEEVFPYLLIVCCDFLCSIFLFYEINSEQF
jgi:hypothetical protein